MLFKYFSLKNYTFTDLENYKKVNYLLLKDKYRGFIRRPFKRLVKIVIKFINFLHFIPTLYYRPLLNTITDLLFDFFKKEIRNLNRFKDYKSSNKEHTSDNESLIEPAIPKPIDPKEFKGHSEKKVKPMEKENLMGLPKSNMNDENRSYLVLDKARITVADFCVDCLKAVTATLFHFWVIKVSFSF